MVLLKESSPVGTIVHKVSVRSFSSPIISNVRFAAADGREFIRLRLGAPRRLCGFD
jgi:hypothetical protein